MLTLDTEKQANWRKETGRENSAALRHKALLDDIKSNTISVEDDNAMDVSRIEARMGRPMASSELMRRLKLINPALIFERSIKYPNLFGIYINQQERSVTHAWVTKKVHVCGMESGIMPEFSVLHKQTKEVPNPDVFGNVEPTRDLNWKNVETFAGETRGWRTILIRLLRAGLITRLDVEKFFGWAPSQESSKWFDKTR